MRSITASIATMASLTLLSPVSGADERVCTVNDYNGLSAMNGPAVAECLDTNDNNSTMCAYLIDASELCLTQALFASFASYASCSDPCEDPVGDECFICERAAAMIGFVSVAPVVNPGVAACTADDQTLMSTLAGSDVQGCAEGARADVGPCVPIAANASLPCQHCFTRRSHRAIAICTSDCANTTSNLCVQCMEAEYIGSAAHCVISGVDSILGLSILSIAALISLALIA